MKTDKKTDSKKHFNGDWKKYVGSIWENLFIAVGAQQKGIVVEIAPGGVNKIGYGLASIDFQGTIYIIEPNEKALSKIVAEYEKIMPKVEIIKLQKKLGEAIEFLPQKVNLVLANHPLDDIIVGKIIDNAKFGSFFDDHYEPNASPEKTRDLWKAIVSDKKKMLEVQNSVVEEFKELFQKTNPDFVIISQYKSYFFQSNRIFEPDEKAYEVIKLLRRMYKRSLVGSRIKEKNISDLNRWLILKNPKI
jgi:hypothetical protein